MEQGAHPQSQVGIVPDSHLGDTQQCSISPLGLA